MMHAKSALYANFMLDKLLSGLGDHGRYPTKIWSDMKTELVSDETITKDGAASLQRGVETVGGKLYLTDQRLIFEPQRINIQRGATVVLFEDILNTTLCWTKIINLIPSLLIHLLSQQQMSNTDLLCSDARIGRPRSTSSGAEY